MVAKFAALMWRSAVRQIQYTHTEPNYPVMTNLSIRFTSSIMHLILGALDERRCQLF